MQEMVDVLKVVGEPTRLRILALVDRCELTTSELCQILAQTQPRVSRHLKLLTDSGLLKRYAEGVKAYYRLADLGESFELLQRILELLDANNPQLTSDLSRLEQVRSERANKASSYFSSVASDWDQIRKLHVPDGDVEQNLLASVEGRKFEKLLDIGSGTGRMIQLLADQVESAIGIDNNAEMLNLARSNLDAPQYKHCLVRKGSAYALELEDATVDIVVLHQVLHFLDDPQLALREAARVLRPGGRVLVVDFAEHQIERLRIDYNHLRLGFSDERVTSWLADTGSSSISRTRLAPKLNAQEKLTVTLWSADFEPIGTGKADLAAEEDVVQNSKQAAKKASETRTYKTMENVL